jgi:ribose transport system permease protein
MKTGFSKWFSSTMTDYGMIVALFILCAYFSWKTVETQYPAGKTAADQVCSKVMKKLGADAKLIIVSGKGNADIEFSSALENDLLSNGVTPVDIVQGQPADLRRAIEKASASGTVVNAIACTNSVGAWQFIENLDRSFPSIGKIEVFIPETYRWPDFLKPDNMLNIANQIVVIAIIAIGMTMVIITGGIDLSVGSLIALSAVTATYSICRFGGAENATASSMILSSILGIGVCALIGFCSGLLVAKLNIPSFIVTLSTMLVGSGIAYIVARGQSIYQVPESFIWLGRGTVFGCVPVSVILMIILYFAAHVMMSRTVLGRYIYAVGGNKESARLSGVSVDKVIIFVYSICAALAGLGGIITASQLKSGSPNYGQMYELYVIAAVVVGGTSLLGGAGKIFGTLIGAFIMAVIQNGMNLTGVESYTQKVILGLVILGAVMLDMMKKSGKFTGIIKTVFNFTVFH